MQDPFLDKKYQAAFKADYKAKVLHYIAHSEDKQFAKGLSVKNKWNQWTIDMGRWIQPWSPIGYKKDPVMSHIDL